MNFAKTLLIISILFLACISVLSIADAMVTDVRATAPALGGGVMEDRSSK